MLTRRRFLTAVTAFACAPYMRTFAAQASFPVTPRNCYGKAGKAIVGRMEPV